MTMSDHVSPFAQGRGGGVEPARPPLNPPLHGLTEAEQRGGRQRQSAVYMLLIFPYNFIQRSSSIVSWPTRRSWRLSSGWVSCRASNDTA